MVTVYHYLNLIVYNVNLFFLVLILLGSFIMSYIVWSSICKERSKLRRLKKEETSTLNRELIRNGLTAYSRDRIVFTIIIFEILMRTSSFINIVVLDVLQHGHNATNNNNNNNNVTDNCTLLRGTALYRVHSRGYFYNLIVSLFLSLNVMVISLICYLNLFLINVYTNDKRKRFKYGYLIYSVIKCALIIILDPITETYLLSQLIYIVSFTSDYLFLVYLTRKLYKIIINRYRMLTYHGNEEELKHKGREGRNIRIFKQFTTLLLISYGFHVLGQNLQTIIVSLIGSVLENQCWFRVTYGITYEINFLRSPFEMAGIVSVYLEFILGTLFNIGLLVSYVSYGCIVQIERRRRVFRYHIERVSIKEPLLRRSDH